MVVVRIELWPHGVESQKRPLGEIRITNDDSGNEDVGNYEVELKHSGRYWGKPGNWKTGHVVGFLRQMSPYHLVAMALEACGIRTPD